jgi:hypothetical protein
MGILKIVSAQYRVANLFLSLFNLKESAQGWQPFLIIFNAPIAAGSKIKTPPFSGILQWNGQQIICLHQTF